MRRGVLALERSGPAQRRAEPASPVLVDPRTRNLFALALVAVVVLTGAAAFLLGGRGPGDPDAPPDADQMVGVIVGVQAQGLTDVRGFTLRTNDGASVAFTIGALENGAEFPPGHLVEHQATAQPIRVWFRTEGGVKVAIRLEDAT